MSFLEETIDEQGNLDFSWGSKLGKGGPNKDVQFYESFTYDGVTYSLYDCVYMWRDDLYEPDIGKLMKVWETASHKRKVKIVWFFRPTEISNWLGDVKPLKDELFLASGVGTGLLNINPLEAICGKCKVVCTSNDKRNLQASEEELQMAEYIFCRTFDVGNCTISDKFTDMIAGHPVGYYFNKRTDQKAKSSKAVSNLKEKAREVGIPGRAVKYNYSSMTARPLKKVWQALLLDTNTIPMPKAFLDTDNNVLAKISHHQPVARKGRFLEELPCVDESDIRPFKKRMLQVDSLGSEEDPAKSGKLLPSLPNYIQDLLNSKHPFNDKSGLPDGVNISKKPGMILAGQSGQQKGLCETFEVSRRPDVNLLNSKHSKRGVSMGVNINKKAGTSPYDRADQSRHQKGLCETLEVSRRPYVESDKWFKEKESDKWFKQKSWQEKIEEAHETGCLVLLENLKPSYTSQEVEDIIWHAFQEKVGAKMIQHNSFCNPYNGQALIIFKSKDAADSILSQLKSRILMLGDQRPLLARRKKLEHLVSPPNFFGHLPIARPRSQKMHHMKSAVSTSHFSQQNTIEYEMAVQWQALQKKSTTMWDALHKQQAEEIELLVSQLKTQ